MHRIARNHIQYAHDKSHDPILSITSGAYVCLETYDARTGTIRTDEDLLDHPHPDGANPITGPIYVEDAEPGDSLQVHILDITLADQGFLAVKKGVGLLAHRAEQYATKVISIADGMASFGNRVNFPPVMPCLQVIQGLMVEIWITMKSVAVRRCICLSPLMGRCWHSATYTRQWGMARYPWSALRSVRR